MPVDRMRSGFGEMSHNPEHSISHTLSKYLLGERNRLGSRFWARAGGPSLQDLGTVEDNGFNRDDGEPYKVLFGNCSGPLECPLVVAVVLCSNTLVKRASLCMYL